MDRDALVRGPLETNTLFPSCFSRSLTTLSLAVAVVANIGTVAGSEEITLFKLPYSSLKSCPQSDMQCASSITKSPILIFFSFL